MCNILGINICDGLSDFSIFTKNGNCKGMECFSDLAVKPEGVLL